MKHPIPALTLVLTTFSGCGDSATAGTTGDDEGATPTSSGGAEDGDESSTGGAPTTGDESTGAPFEPFPARGEVKFLKVEANPGVAIKLEENGAPLSGADRNAYLPKQRDVLLRVFLDVPDDWTARKIEARVELSGGGVEATYSDVFVIEGDTYENKIDSGPYFGLRAEHVVPGVKYQVSLWEAEPGQEDAPEPMTPAVTPLAGPAPLGVESAFAELRIVLVPVDYAFGQCASVVDGAAESVAFSAAIFQQNAVESLDMQVHAPFKVTLRPHRVRRAQQLVGEMSQLRTAEGADPNVYYYGLFDNCGECIGAAGILSGCTVGLAFDITGSDMNDAFARAAAGQLNSRPDDTFVHEIGHVQGRRHIECAGAGVQAAGTDPSYPYEDGRDRRVGLRGPRLPAAPPDRELRLHELLRADVGVGLAVERDVQAHHRRSELVDGRGRRRATDSSSGRSTPTAADVVDGPRRVQRRPALSATHR
jgi:hypothetical protein